MLKLQKFGKYNEIETCPHCGEFAGCDECYHVTGNCRACGESISFPETHLIFTMDRYNGAGSFAQDTVSLMVDGTMYASAHINKLEMDKSADVAHMHIYIPTGKETNEIAKIIADFARWVRFQWVTMDKKVDNLPAIVRLMGCITHKNTPFPHRLEWFVALRNACDITVEHLAYEFTNKEG
jgi:hypothetical protein